jgi:hypothetical protein
MFIWVVLILEALEKRDVRLSDEAIEYKLEQIPLTLLDTYTAILHDCPPSREEDMWRILRWLFYGNRSLTVTELEKGLCLETEISGWHGFSADVEYLYGSLIRFQSPRNGIKFVHQTARDFIEILIQDSSSADIAGIAMTAQAANESMATAII